MIEHILLSPRDPAYVTGMSAWYAHVPLASLLMDLLRPRIFVELGTQNGDSYCAFCQAVDELELSTKCFSVDHWRGDEQGGFYGEEVFESLRRYHDPLYARFSNLIRSSFDDSVGDFSDGSIDLLHIDGCHAYDSVKHDFMTWLPKMSDDGVVLLHDVSVRGDGFGVWRLWEEVSKRFPCLLMPEHSGLGIVGVGSSSKKNIAWLSDNVGKGGKYEKLINFLGEHVLLMSDAVRIKKEISALHEALESKEMASRTALEALESKEEELKKALTLADKVNKREASLRDAIRRLAGRLEEEGKKRILSEQREGKLLLEVRDARDCAMISKADALRCQSRIEELHRSCADAEAQRDSLAQTIEEIRRSYSWKLYAPLRSVFGTITSFWKRIGCE